MLNLKEEITLCLLRRGTSMRKVAKVLREQGFDIPISSGLSSSINKKRVRFETVQQILDYLGYKLVIEEK